MAKQKQPRPNLTREGYGFFTEVGVTGVIPNIKYHYYLRKFKTSVKETQFARYPLSRGDARPLNPLANYLVYDWQKYPVVQATIANPDGAKSLYQCGLPVISSSLLSTTRVEHGAVTKVLAEISDAKVDLMTFWAERQKTADMLRHRLIQAYYALRAVKRGNLAKAVRIVKNGKSPTSLRASDLRLEFVYGWKPLVLDIHGLCTKVPPVPSQKVSGSFKRPFFERKNFGSKDNPENPFGTDIISGHTSAKCILFLEMNVPLIASAQSLGLINPANTVWELVPFSFVVDWFLPIGQYIQQFDALSGFNVVDQVLISKTRVNSTRVTDRHGSSHYNRKTMSRTKVFNLNPPPYLKNPVSIDHVLNALALIRSVKGGARGWKYG